MDVNVTLGRQLFDSEYRFDLQALRLPAGLGGLSQSIPPRLWALRPVDALDARQKSGVLSQR
jgi:hypothetical protein